MKQEVVWLNGRYDAIDQYINEAGIKHALLVCGSSVSRLRIGRYFNELQQRREIRLTRFSDFKPNPDYSSVEKGVDLMKNQGCDAIIAVGGGSCIDVAKCIKLFHNMDRSESFLTQKVVANELPFAVIPTTAGTGSEATRYAVIYYKGEKQSISDESCIPETVFFDDSVLETLPVYQKKCTLLDAFCHAIESYWSINSTDESKEYSHLAIRLILENMDAYLLGSNSGNRDMLRAAFYGGKAINITQTTAGHAMCYKLTSTFGTAHGYAAALCVRRLWPFMLRHPQQCADRRGRAYLKGVFDELAEAMGCETAESAAQRFGEIIDSFGLPVPVYKDKAQIEMLTQSVNPVRLKNHPVMLSTEDIRKLYRLILSC